MFICGGLLWNSYQWRYRLQGISYFNDTIYWFENHIYKFELVGFEELRNISETTDIWYIL